MDSMLMEATKEVCRTGQEMERRGLVAGTAGNCSIRVANSDLVVITPTSLAYQLCTMEDMIVMNMAGEQVEGRHSPSVEINMHLEIYKARPDVNSVVHTHQMMASAVAVAGKGIPAILEEEVFILLGAIELADYALPGTQDLARSAVAALGTRNACLLRHHGVVAVGAKINDALLHAELVERAATVYIMASILGGAQVIPFMAGEIEGDLGGAV